MTMKQRWRYPLRKIAALAAKVWKRHRKIEQMFGDSEGGYCVMGAALRGAGVPVKDLEIGSHAPWDHLPKIFPHLFKSDGTAKPAYEDAVDFNNDPSHTKKDVLKFCRGYRVPAE